MSDLITMMSAAAGAGGEEADPNFNQTVLLLHGDGTNGAQNNTFLDSSTNTFTITPNGNVTQGTFTPFSAPDGRWSNYIDGSGDYFSLAGSTDFDFGTGDFTISCWIYFNSYETTAGFIVGQNFFSSVFQLNSSGQLQFYSQPAGAYTVTGSTSLLKNEWVHVAVTRSGNTFKVFLNGSVDGTGTNSSGAGFSSGSLLTIAAWNNTAASWTGYISNLSILKGTAIDFASTGVPTAPLSTSTTNQKLLTCYGNRFADFNTATTAKTITVNGNPSVQPFSPFAPSAAYSPSVNGGSGYFDGSGDYLTTPSNSAFDFGTGDFTIEFWAYKNVATNNMALVGTRTGDSSISIRLSTYINNTGYFECDVWDTSGARMFNFAHQTLFIPGTWNHCALVRNGTSFYLYFNGVQSTSSGTSSAAVANSSLVFRVGDFDTSSLIDFNGYISSLRVIKGTALYTSNFTPPTAPLTAVSGTSLLTNFTNAGILDNTGKNDLETVGNAQIDTTTKKYGTGSMEFDGTGDWLLGQFTPNFVWGTEDFTVEAWVYPTSLSPGADRNIVDFRDGDDNTSFRTGINGTNVPYVANTGGILNGSFTFSTNIWYHFAVTRASGTLTIWINGSSVGSNTTTTNFTGKGLIIGASAASGSRGPFFGFIDDLRITKGVARYTTTFTPPDKAFPDL